VRAVQKTSHQKKENFVKQFVRRPSRLSAIEPLKRWGDLDEDKRKPRNKKNGNIKEKKGEGTAAKNTATLTLERAKTAN